MLSSGQISNIDSLCKKYDRKDYPGIAIAIAENGDLIFCKGYGSANLSYNIPIDGDTVFHVCSISKQFTAACIALLIEEGKLRTDEDIRNIFPQLKDCGNKITIYNLLYMTNGLPDVYNTANFVCGIREDTNINRDEFWKYVTACDWTFFKPGERWSYGNTGYFLLGEVIRVLTDKSLSQYADERIFKPLGMNNTFIRDDRTKIIKNKAVGYSNYDHIHYNDSYERYCSRNDTLSVNEENVDVGGAGQLWTTVKDFYLWDRNFYNNILGKGSKEFTTILTTPGTLNNGKKCVYGCGLFQSDFYGNKLIQHGGWAGGYSAIYARLPEKKTSVIIFGNHTDFMYDIDYDTEGGLTNDILRLIIDGNEECNKHNQIFIERENKQEENNVCHPDFELSGKYMDPISSRVLDIKNENENYLIKDYLTGDQQVIYQGNGIFKSEDGNKVYEVFLNAVNLPESIQLREGEISSKFYPFIRNKSYASELKEYEGDYCCISLGVTYHVKADQDKLFISNNNCQNNALDLYYTPAIKDTFISVPNKYIAYYCMTFHRDSDNRIISFSYRDDEKTLREKFEFTKIS